MKQFIVEVAIENVAYHFDILYTYSVPEKHKNKALPGMRVMVPFGRSKSAKRQGVIFSVAEKEPQKGIKSILEFLDEENPFVSEEMLKIAVFLKERTFCTYFEAVKVQMPVGFTFKTTENYFAISTEKTVKLNEEQEKVYRYMLSFDSVLSKKQIFSDCSIEAESDVLQKLIAKKLVVKTYDAVKKLGDLTQKTALLTVSDENYDSVFEKLTQKQQGVVNVLRDVGEVSLKEICYFTGVTTGVLKTLQKKGVIEINDRPKYRIPEVSFSSKASNEIVLTDAQQKAFNELLLKYRNGSGASLLYGITGSGKTSVFLKLIDEVINEGRQVIVMVPEIALTPQMMSIFKGRYGNEVAIFHSALSAGERKDEYRRAANGEVKIVVGTRSAVFAPFNNLGLIVIDEEQEHTYKSESSPRYHTKDVAKFRAANHNALLLLSSATPSIESYSNAVRGAYSLHTLAERYGSAVLPDVTVVDMKKDKQSGNKYAISSELLEALEKNLNDKKQSILLINRRGYNTFAACDSCGSVITCPSCSISMTYHSANNRLMCHYCGYSAPFMNTCPDCGKNDVRYSGFGTQKIEKEIEELLPEARVLRMDTDSTSSRQEFEKGLSDFSDGKYDIMLGTQMVAKGLDFEKVTLVGVISADQQLNNDDFRSEEKTFDLLTQVVGRAGRGENKGTAIIQTMTPENHIIRLAQKQDYNTFYENEIIIRKTMLYPPYCDLCSVCFISENENSALKCSKEFLTELRGITAEKYINQKIIVLGPMPPRLSKINNKFRYRIIIKCKNSKDFRSMISELLIKFGKNNKFRDVTLTADINPENLA